MIRVNTVSTACLPALTSASRTSGKLHPSLWIIHQLKRESHVIDNLKLYLQLNFVLGHLNALYLNGEFLFATKRSKQGEESGTIRRKTIKKGKRISRKL